MILSKSHPRIVFRSRFIALLTGQILQWGDINDNCTDSLSIPVDQANLLCRLLNGLICLERNGMLPDDDDFEYYRGQVLTTSRRFEYNEGAYLLLRRQVHEKVRLNECLGSPVEESDFLVLMPSEIT